MIRGAVSDSETRSDNSIGVPQKPRRRLLRFSLAKMLLAVAGIAIILAWLMPQIRQTQQELEIAAMVETLGGSVTWGGLLEGRGRNGRSYIGAIDLSGAKITDEHLARSARCRG